MFFQRCFSSDVFPADVFLGSSVFQDNVWSPADPKELKIGDPIPKVSLKASDGKTYNLPEIAEKGEALIIAWIPKTFTPG